MFRAGLGRDFGILVLLGLFLFFLTGFFQTVVPYGILTRQARHDAKLEESLKALEKLNEVEDPFSLSPAELDERTKILAPLMVLVPGGKFALAASLVIIFPVGWLAGKMMSRPEFSGMLLVLSVGTGQNPVLIPRGLEYMGMGEIALPFGQEVALVLFQFTLLGLGIFAHSKVRDDF